MNQSPGTAGQASRLTEAKKQGALDAIAALMECGDFPRKGTTTWAIEYAAAFIRELPVAQ